MAQLDPLKQKDSCDEVRLISNPSIRDAASIVSRHFSSEHTLRRDTCCRVTNTCVIVIVDLQEGRGRGHECFSLVYSSPKKINPHLKKISNLKKNTIALINCIKVLLQREIKPTFYSVGVQKMFKLQHVNT